MQKGCRNRHPFLIFITGLVEERMDPAGEPADEQLSVRTNNAVVPLEIGRVFAVEFLLAGNEHGIVG